MMQIIAWVGAACCLLAGLGMLFAKAAPEKRMQTRLLGLLLITLVPFNVWLALRVI
jgi:hypothetical protein